jgi:hypothetical protein
MGLCLGPAAHRVVAAASGSLLVVRLARGTLRPLLLMFWPQVSFG